MAVRLLKSIFTGVASLNFGRSGPEELVLMGSIMTLHHRRKTKWSDFNKFLTVR